MSEPLTDEQIKNWRKALTTHFGPYALIMPREQIQAMRDKMQRAIDTTADTPATTEGDCFQGRAAVEKARRSQ